jgi:hypothetical protein
MKISLVIVDGYKQVMFTPETDHEKSALKMIAPGDTLIGVSKWGTFDDERRHVYENVEMCKGGYLRRFAQQDSLMFVIDDKQKENKITKEK